MPSDIQARSKTAARRSAASAIAVLGVWLVSATAVADSCTEAVAAAPPRLDCPLQQVPRSRLFPLSPLERRCREAPPLPCVLCRIVECQLERGCDPGGGPLSLSPAADTVFLRRGVTVDLPPGVRQAMIAAAVSHSPRFALQVTQEARAAPQPAVRYAASLTAALAILRSDLAGFRREFDALVARMRADAPALPFSTADVDFLSAQAALADASRGKALAALDRALAKEPEFLAAAALAVSIAVSEIDARRHALGACRDGFRRLYGYLARMLDLRPCPRMAVHVENFLVGRVSDPLRSPALAGAQVYLAILARRPDAARTSLSRLRTLPRFACQGEVVAELDEAVGVARARGR